MDHTLQYHLHAINELCRICAKLALTRKEKRSFNKKSKCRDFQFDILSVFGIDISTDNDTKHSSHICRKCTSRIRNVKKLKSPTMMQAAHSDASKLKNVWVEFNVSDTCLVCNRFKLMGMGNPGLTTIKSHEKLLDNSGDTEIQKEIIPDKSQRGGCDIPLCPTGEEQTVITGPFVNLLCPPVTYSPGGDLPAVLIESTSESDSLSFCDLSNTTETQYRSPSPLSHMSLSRQRTGQLNSHEHRHVTALLHSTPKTRVALVDSQTSPVFKTDVHMSHLPITHTTAASPITCTDQTTKIQKSFTNIQTSPAFKYDLSLTDSLSFPTSQPLLPLEEKLATRLIKRKAEQEGNSLSCKTGGQPLTVQIVSKPRKNYTDISTSTKRRKCKEIEAHRSISIGIKEDNIASELSNEFKRNNDTIKNKVIENTGLKKEVTLDNTNVVAMKVDCGLSYQQLRKARQYLKKDGVHVPHEKKQRDLCNEITQDFIQTRNNVFDSSEGSEIIAPVGSIGNLTSFIISHLDSLNQTNQLTWHSGIPDNEIWIKFGGDHGKDSFKLTMQVVNVDKPNSKNNTIVLAMAYVKDSYDNLSIIMSDTNLQLENLAKLYWNGKLIKLFVFGDYDFYSKTFGISGARGTHPCLWCKISQKQIQQEQYTRAELRTLDSIKTDCDKWETETNADKKYASHFNNCINRPMINIELDRVAPPYLHILLGIMKKHHELLEKAADKLDQQIKDQHEDDTIGVKSGSIACSLIEYGSNWMGAEDKKETIRYVEALEVFGCEATKKSTRLEDLRDDLDNLPKTDIRARTGPIASQLDEKNKESNVIAQNYHGRSYIGNHCHTYFMKKVYEKCTTAIVEKTHELTKNTSIRRDSQHIKDTFDQLNNAYRQVHIHISHCEQISESELQFIDTLVHTYMSLYRTHFPNKVIPKQHFLEVHCVPWINRYGFGLGLHGEQGGELIHSTIAQAERSGRHIRKDQDKLKTVMKTHFLMTAPSLNNLTPQTQRRNKKTTVVKKLF